MIFIVGSHGVGKGTAIETLTSNPQYKYLNLQLCNRVTNKNTTKVKAEFPGIRVSDLSDNISSGKIPILELNSGIEDFLHDNNLITNKNIIIIFIRPKSDEQILEQIVNRGRNK